MPSLISTIPEVDNLYMENLPSGRPIKIERAVRVDGITVMVGASGRLYCDRLGKFAYMPGEYPWMTSLMEALLKIGVITNDQMQAHLLLCERKETERARDHDAEYLIKMSNRHGFKLTAAQRQALGIST